MSTKIERPEITSGKVICKTTGCGHLYVQIAGDDLGHDPIELLASLGKAGGCAKCQNEALSRLVTLLLKYSAPIEEIVDELVDIGCPSAADGKLSCPDAIGKALKTYQGVKIK